MVISLGNLTFASAGFCFCCSPAIVHCLRLTERIHDLEQHKQAAVTSVLSARTVERINLHKPRHSVD